MEAADLHNRFAYHAPGPGKQEAHADLRNACFLLASAINELCPDSREKSLAVTSIEEAMFWGNAALARHNTETGARL